MKSAEEMKKVFLDHGVDLSRPIATSCQAGIIATVLFAALETVGHSSDLAVYDGSFAEFKDHMKQ